MSSLAPRPSFGAHSTLPRSSTKSLRTLSITSKGFQFLLEDVNTQLWDLLLQYLEEASVSDVDRASRRAMLLSFVRLAGRRQSPRIPFHAWIARAGSSRFPCGVQLSLLLIHNSQGYSTESFSETELVVLHDLRDYGLVYQPSVRKITFPEYFNTCSFRVQLARLHRLLPYPPCHHPHFFCTTTRLLAPRRRRARVPRPRDQLQGLCLHRQPTSNRRAQPLCASQSAVPQLCHWANHKGKRA